jgi:acetoin utilization protein AcuB
MLVGERMSAPVISVPPTLPINDALKLMQDKNIRRAPVVQKGKMIGIISDVDIFNASPSQATTLSVWELHHLISKITVSSIMTKQVISVTEDTPIEIAARIMADNKIGGLPVTRGEEVVGMITETDLFKIFLELMGAREVGVRVTVLVPEKPGGLAELSKQISSAGGNFIAFGVFTGEAPSNRLVTFKVTGLDSGEVQQLIAPIIEKLIDIRVC